MERKLRGRGMAASWYGIARTATIDRAGAWAELDDGGTAKIVTGVTEIGEGILTLLCQVAADELGIKPSEVTIGEEGIYNTIKQGGVHIDNTTASAQIARKLYASSKAHGWGFFDAAMMSSMCVPTDQSHSLSS